MADESESLEAVATLRTHHLIKTHKFADDYILLAAKVEWHITTPIDVPSTAGGALLKQILILPNEQRKVDGRVEVFVGDQQANGIAAHKRIIQILQANLNRLELDSVQFDEANFRREPKFVLRPSSNPLPDSVIPKHRITGHLDMITIRLTFKLNPKRSSKSDGAVEDPFAEDGFGDAEEESILQELGSYRLPECLVPTLDSFCERFVNIGLGQGFPLMFNGGVKAYYRREAAGITKVVTSMKAMIQMSKNKSFRKKNGKIFQTLEKIMMENNELMNRLITRPGETPDEDELADAVQDVAERNTEEEDEGERFQRSLCEGMMALCVNQCSKSKLKCEVPDMPSESELNQGLPAPPSPRIEDGLIEEDIDPLSAIAHSLEAFEVAAIRLRTLSQPKGPTQEDDPMEDIVDSSLNPSLDIVAEELPDAGEDMLSDTLSENICHDQDLLSDEAISQGSSISTGSQLSEDVWSFSNSATGSPLIRSFRDTDTSSLLLGSPPVPLGNHPRHSSLTSIAHFSEETTAHSPVNVRNDGLEFSGRLKAHAMDCDDEGVYDF